MTFPQTPSSGAVVAGNEFWRLNTLLAGPGDLYESVVGALAFVVGPDSDIANYQVSYFDTQSDVMLSQFILSPRRDLIGRIAAQNPSVYPGPGSRKGRILISLADIWDPEWTPAGFSAETDTYQAATPVIDVLQYFKNPPSVVPQRSDRLFRFQYFLDASSGTANIAVPAYGRKSGWFTFLNHTGSDIDVNVDGVRLSTSSTPGTRGNFEKTILPSTPVADNSQADFSYKASVHGQWDLFVVQLPGYNGGPFPMTITLSDDEA